MSGPYDQQQAAGFNVHLTGATGGVTQSAQQTSSRTERRRQRSGSSTSLSSDGGQAGKAAAAGNSVNLGGGGGGYLQQQYGVANGFGAQAGGYGAQAGGYGAQAGGYGAQAGGFGQFGSLGQATNFGQSGASFGSIATGGPRRQGRYQKQVIRLPDQGVGQVRQVRRRLPTPEPDTLERVYIQKAGAEIIEEITEVPTTPPPRIQERTVVEPAGPPQVIRKTIRVPPRGGNYGAYQQQGQQQLQQNTSFAVSNLQGSSNLLSAGSYGNVQQGALSGGFGSYGGGFGGAAPGGYTGGFGGAAAGGYTGGFGGAAPGGYTGGFGGFQGQQSFGFGSQGVRPNFGVQPAFCFQV